MPFTFTCLGIPALILVESRQFIDERGAFFETFKASEFEAAELPTVFVQDNQSRSVPGVVRGVHFQRAPHAQGKLVSVVSGAVWDVGVDLRAGSSTFAQWVGVELRAGDGRMLWIPEGFGHGFVVLGSDDAVLSYKCTREYSGPHDGGVRWDDPTLAIAWPLDREPVLSDKDRGLPLLAELAV
jgi:dTDP-4-dehydrorhamnose 3,5-epimerase